MANRGKKATEVHAAAIYVRISKDADGHSTAIERQLEDCRKLAKARGWPIFGEYVDHAKSAFRVGGRPEYNRMVDDIRAGVIDAVIIWNLDRLMRHPYEFEVFLQAIDERGEFSVATYQGDIDLTTSDGRAYARVIVAFAKKEVDDRSRRTERKHQELAEKGMFKGGARGYGYEWHKPTKTYRVVDDERKVILEVAERMLSGETVHAICADLNRRKVPTVNAEKKGSVWRTPTLRAVMTSGRIAGLREHHGEVMPEQTWEAIITTETRDALLALINDPTRSLGTRRPRVSLLAGMVVCGRCGQPLQAGRRARDSAGNPGVRIMRCIKSVDHDGCGRLQVNSEPLERAVEQALFKALDTEKLAALAASDEGPDVEPLLHRATELEEQMNAIMDMLTDGTIDRPRFERGMGRLRTERDQVEAEIRARTHSAVVGGLVGSSGALSDAWADYSLDLKRTILGAVIKSVVVNPSVKRGKNFQRSRIQIDWRS